VVRRVVFAVPGSLDTPTGGYAYDRRIVAELRQLGWDVECLDIGAGFPSPDEATRSAARSLLLKVPDGQPIVVDGLALGVLPDVAGEVASRHPLLGLVHHPLALEWGLSAERANALHGSEQAALGLVREPAVLRPVQETAERSTACCIVRPREIRSVTLCVTVRSTGGIGATVPKLSCARSAYGRPGCGLSRFKGNRAHDGDHLQHRQHQDVDASPNPTRNALGLTNGSRHQKRSAIYLES